MAHKPPNIILLDIETSPIVGYTWSTFDTNVLKILESSKIISVAWKELHDKEVTVKCISDYKGYKKGVVDDKALVKEVWDVLDKADIVIAHHGNAFDLKKLNSRFVFHGLDAPSAYKSIDTCLSSKKYFKFDSNSLSNLGQYLGVGDKQETGGFGLWVRCLEGDQKAWNKMKMYNAGDVDLLERVYLRLRPFIDNHPDLNIITGNGKTKPTCGTCLSTEMQKRGMSFTKTGSKQRYQCKSCGSWSTGAFERSKVTEEDTVDVS